MLVSTLVHCIAVLVFQLCGVQTLSSIHACPASCVCEETWLVNCASLGLPKAPSHIPATTTTLDLSHNALHTMDPLGAGHMHLHRLQHLRVGNNSLESLSMCSGSQKAVGTRTLTRRKQTCVSWAPDLQSLSADRNQLKCLPRGLGNIKSLKVIQLSHNRISEIGPADLAGCTHLNELHLQYNLINTIHPEAFKDLQELKVLDVSYNLLATIPVPAYLSLQNLNVLVDISENRWSCDCNLKTIKRWLSFDSELGNPTWEVVCFSPPHHAGKSLLYLKESDLACPQPVYSTPGVKKEVTVDEGMELILSCSTANQDFMHTRWWTPHGHISDNQRFLHISKTTEHDAGLYVCISGYQEEQVSVFSLHVHKRAHDRRLRRDIGSVEFNLEDKDTIQRNVPDVRAVQQSQLALAVSLSVIITFIVAFVLGVVLRPFLEKCYKQIRSKRNSTTSPPNSRTTSTAQGPYVNEGYSDTDDQEQEVHVGPRVTFGGVTEIHEQGGVPYYVTVEGSSSGSNTAVSVHKEGMQFEYIPDPEDTAEFEQKSISATSSLSGEQQESYEVKGSIEQSVDSPTVSIYDEEDEQASTDQQATIPGFITDPFPLKMSESKEQSVDELDPDLWNDSGESFSFTEGSPRSSSRASQVAALGYPKTEKEMSVDEVSDRPSSCNSSKSGESEGEPFNQEGNEHLETQVSYLEDDDINYNENRLPNFDVDILNKKPQTGKRHATITLDPTDIHMTYTQGDSFNDELCNEYKESYPSSNSDYEDEPAQYNVHPVYRNSQKATSQMEDVSLTGSEDDEYEQGEYTRSLEITLEEKDPTTDAIPVITERTGSTDSTGSVDIEVKSSKEKERGIFKGLSGLGSRLFNRSGSETNKKGIQPEPDTATTNSKGTGGFLGLSFKKQPTTPSETVNPTTNDNFFVTIGQAFDRLPKVKNSLRFSMSEPKSPHQQKSTSEVDKISESDESHASSYFDDSIFGKTNQTLDPITRVKRYLYFSQSQSYPPIQFSPRSTEKLIPTESKKFSPEHNFFAEIDASLDDLPKVKRYIQFSPSESLLDSKLATSVNQVSIPVVMLKTEFPSDTISISYRGQSISLQTMPRLQRYVQFSQSKPQTRHEPSTPINEEEDNFFGHLVPISFDEVPKVKQYMQFSPSELQISFDSTPATSVNQVAIPVVVSKTESPSDTISITYGGQSISLQTMPKVQRYIQFSEVPKVKQYQQFSPPKSPISSDSTTKVSEPVVVSKTESSPDTIGITYGGESISLQTMPKVQRYLQFFEVPKVKQYGQFSPPKSQISSSLAPKVSTPVVVSKTESSPDTIGITYGGQSIYLQTMPKVQRYLQFFEVPKVKQYQKFSPPKSPISSDSTPKVSEPVVVSKTESSPDTIGITYGGESISLQTMPKVQRYIQFVEVPKIKQYGQFSPPKSPISSDSTPKVSTPVVVSKTESPSDKIGITYGGQSISLQTMPKVQRYLQFSEVPKVKQYQQFSPPKSPISSDSTLKVSEPVVVSKTESSPDTIGITYGGQSVSLQTMPKVQRYLQFFEVPKFEQYGQFSPPKSPISSVSTPKVSTPVVVSKTESLSDTIGITYGGQSISLQTMPKVQRYVQFSEVPKVKQYGQFSPPKSPISSASTPKVSEPVVVSKTESPSDTIGITYGGQSVSLQTMPKVQRYLQFSEVPKVKQYQQFSPPKSPISSDSTPKVSEPVGVSKTESPSDTIGITYGGQSISLQTMQKVQRYLQFSEVPKVKQYQKFSPPKSPISSDSTPKVSEPVVVSKTESSPDTIGISYGGQSISLQTMPKVQRYVQFSEVPKVKQYQKFSPPKSPISSDSTPKVSEPVVVSKTESSPDTIGISYGGQSIYLQTMPKVQRYVQFSEVPKVKQYGQFSPPKSPISSASTPKVSEPVVVSKTESPSDTIGITYGGQSISLQTMPKVQRYLQFSEVPKVKQYQQFSPPKSPISSVSTPKVSTPVVVSKTESPSDTIGITYGGQSISLQTMPKVQRYIQFVEVPKIKQYGQFSPPKSPISSDSTPKVSTPVVVSKTEFSPDTIGITYGGQSVSLQTMPKVQRYLQFFEVPKVKQYQQFSPPKSQISSSLAPKVSIPVVLSKTESSPDTIGITYGGQSISLQTMPKVQRYLQFSEVPKVKQYGQFSPPKSPISSSLAPKVSEPVVVSKTESLPDTIGITYGGQSIYLQTMPKVQRYVQFSEVPEVKQYGQLLPSKSQISSSLAPKVSTPVVLSKTESPSDTTSITYEEQSISLQTMPKVQRYVQFSEVPKVKQYGQFSPPKSQISSDLTPKVSTPVVVSKTESPSDTIGITYGGQSVSLQTMPKVQRYLQFSEVPKVKQYGQFSPPKSPISSSLAPKVSTPVVVSKTESLSDTIGITYGGQSISLQTMPKVQRYVQFSEVPEVKQYGQLLPSKSQISSSLAPKVSTPVVLSKTESPSDTIGITYGGQSISLQTMPKVQRYVQFSEVPKVKQYGQFSPPKSPISSVSTPKVSTPVLGSKTESPSDTIGITYGGESVSLQTMPKVQRYIQFVEVPKIKQYGQFSPPKSQISSSLAPKVSTPVVVSKTESLPDTIGITYGGQSISLQTMPKVQRYVQFSEVPKVKQYGQFSPPKSQISSSLAPKVSTPVVVSKTESPSDTIGITYGGESISLQTMPKVQRYVQFSEVPEVKQYGQLLPSKSQISSSLAPKLSTPVVLSKTESPSDRISISYRGQSISLPTMPKVQRYVQFSQSEPPTVHELTIPTIQGQALFGQAPTSFADVPKVKRHILFSQTETHYQTSSSYRPSKKIYPLSDEQITHEIKTTLVTAKPHSAGNNFFVQISASLDGVPKVKRYLQFIKSEPQTSAQSPSTTVTTEYVIPEFSTKMQSKGPESQISLSRKADNILASSLHGLPQVKRYIQFTQSEFQTLAHAPLLSVTKESVIPTSVTKMQSTRSEDKISPIIKRVDLFCITGLSFEELPKVKRYIQFTRAEPHLQPPLRHSLNGTEKSIHASSEQKMKDLASEDYMQPAVGEHSFSRPIGTSSEIPKVRRYIQFSQSSTQTSSLALDKQTARPVLTNPGLLKSSKSNTEDTFYSKMDVGELPKLKRYIQFRQQHSTSPNTHEVTDKVIKKTDLSGSQLSRAEVKPPVSEDQFLGQLGTNLNSLPRLNRYIQFTQSEPYPLHQSQSSSEKMTTNIPVFTQTEYQSNKEANALFGSVDSSSIHLPKIKRNVHITHSEHYRPSEDVFKLTTKKTGSLGQTDGEPRLIRYRQFRESEPPTQISSSSILESRMLTTTLKPGTATDLSQLQDVASGIGVTTETSRSHPLPQLKQSPYTSNLDVYRPPDQGCIQTQEVFRQTSSNSSSGDVKYANTHESSSTVALSTTESALQDGSQSSHDKPATSLGKDDAREYLRDSSLARQRQERRRLLFQQKRRAMDGFSLSSESFTSQDSDQ